jgi:DNA-binding transcriptional ArsR family regulator
MPDDPELRRLLWFVLGGARGGENRARMLQQLRLRPSNLNQLAEALGVDYRTIMHHAEILKENSLVVTQGDRYGAMYFVSPRLEAGIGIFDEIVKKLGFRLTGAE